MREFYADYYRGGRRADFMFEAKDAKEALELGRAKYDKEPWGLDFKPCDHFPVSLEQIIIYDRTWGGEISWQSEDYTLREASSDLLEALKGLTEFVERYAYSVDVSGYLDAARAAIAKARPPSP